MKRFCLALLALVGAASLANAQIIRPAGVVRQTTVKVEREKTAGHWENEVGHWTHSVGALVGKDVTVAKEEDSIIAVDYNLQYRFNPLFSAGIGAWCGFSDNYEDDFGMNLRANLKLHPLATIAPESKYQPYLALWGEWLIPNDEVHNNSEGDGTDALAWTAELGCDIYGGRFPFYISLNATLREDYTRSPVGAPQPYAMVCLILKGGIKF